MKAIKQDERAEDIKQLKKWLKPGTTVFCVLRNVSASGMNRTIDFYVVRKGDICCISGYIGRVLGYSRGKGDGLRIQGCGMDMGFNTVYNLSRTLFPKGFIPAKAGTHGRNGSNANEVDTDGGYALKHRWI